MTNAQKYEEIFGFPPDKEMCPAAECKICPVENCEPANHSSLDWWDSEYKEPEVKV